ncbi:MAG: hypothetical protein IJ240_01110 [Clostridia bacterium]|nr:hypothetical protein [Clostridia bacterium]
MAAGIWVRLVRHGRTERDATAPCEKDAWQEGLTEACRMLDLQRPYIVPKHERDFAQFGQTRFLPEHFVESVSFDRMEVEYIDPDAKKGKRINEKYL